MMLGRSLVPLTSVQLLVVEVGLVAAAIMASVTITPLVRNLSGKWQTKVVTQNGKSLLRFLLLV
jgi:hypothetical protein